METFKAVVKKTTTGLQCEANSRGFKMILDEPEELGGTDTGMNPVEAVICALGGCQAIVAAAFAEGEGFEFEEFYVEIEGDLDPAGFMGDESIRPGYQEIRYKMHFKTNETQERAEEFAKFIEKRCPVGDCLTNGVKMVSTGVVRD